MSGHSKWSQIKHKKALTDAKKGKIFGKLGRAISIAARGNPDPTTNLRLKGEIEQARSYNMPNETIDRAISRVSDKNASALSEIQVELIGPGNAAIIVTAITDNSNRTINDLKRLALARGAHMAGQGAVMWMFKRTGVIHLSKTPDEELQLLAIDAGADNIISEEGGALVYTPPEHLQRVKTALKSSAVSSGIELIASPLITLPNENNRTQLISLLESLDEHDDVQDVVTNADLS